ncbi:MAG: hypothetical protein JSS03_07480 [Proteobacteria bacterium]|nr:hypothetical protein [Pseudomonadota bacterium]
MQRHRPALGRQRPRQLRAVAAQRLQLLDGKTGELAHVRHREQCSHERIHRSRRS